MRSWKLKLFCSNWQYGARERNAKQPGLWRRSFATVAQKSAQWLVTGIGIVGRLLVQRDVRHGRRPGRRRRGWRCRKFRFQKIGNPQPSLGHVWKRCAKYIFLQFYRFFNETRKFFLDKSIDLVKIAFRRHDFNATAGSAQDFHQQPGAMAPAKCDDGVRRVA